MGAFMFFTGLATSDRPHDAAALFDLLWTPFLQGGLAFLASLGFGTMLKSPGAPEPEPPTGSAL